jgi:hypothetical protein
MSICVQNSGYTLKLKNDLGSIAPRDFREMGYYWKTLGRNVVILAGQWKEQAWPNIWRTGA